MRLMGQSQEGFFLDTVILGIETSCDETSAAVVVNGKKVLSNVISSQADAHVKYGGVVPEIASRKHVELINYVISDALTQAGVTLDELTAIAVTYGPGLIGALLVGLSAAKGLAFACNKPLIGVNHIAGHISANYISNPDLQPPFVCLVVSGGHTHIIKVSDYNKYEVLGQTRDDAAGEAFDKIARVLNLGYPGGPAVEKTAASGDPLSIRLPKTKFKDSYDFSFSGIKTAVINYVHNQEQKGIALNNSDLCASFQQIAVETLTENTISATLDANIDTICLAGGVAANTALRTSLAQACHQANLKFHCPEPILCTDNAAMIASAGYYEYISGNIKDLTLNAYANLKLC